MDVSTAKTLFELCFIKVKPEKFHQEEIAHALHQTKMMNPRDGRFASREGCGVVGDREGVCQQFAIQKAEGAGAYTDVFVIIDNVFVQHAVSLRANVQAESGWIGRLQAGKDLLIQLCSRW